jgi:hypothetical protein
VSSLPCVRWGWANREVFPPLPPGAKSRLLVEREGEPHPLLRSLVEVFVPEGPLVVGIDETLERRYGKKIRAKGIYRDPVRSTHENFVKSSGLRWVCVMLPWWRSLELLGCGPCPSSQLWLLPSVMQPSRAHATRR